MNAGEGIAMGLGMVGILMEIEETFDLRIADEIESLMTVGALHDYLCKRLGARPAQRCLHRPAFRKLQAALAEAYALEPRAIRPRRRLDTLVGKRPTRQRWKQLARRLEWRFPQLARTPGQDVTSWARLVLLITLTLLPFASMGFGALAVTVFVLGLFLAFEHRDGDLTVPVLNTDQSVRALVEHCLWLNPCLIDEPTWTREKVWVALKRIVMEQTLATSEQVRPESHLIRDLGLD